MVAPNHAKYRRKASQFRRGRRNLDAMDGNFAPARKIVKNSGPRASKHNHIHQHFVATDFVYGAVDVGHPAVLVAPRQRTHHLVAP